MSTKLKTDVVLGDRYRDQVTGLEGVATAVTFYLHACERVTIEYLKDETVKYDSFDAPRLIHVTSGKQPAATRTGGPGGREASQNAAPERRP